MPPRLSGQDTEVSVLVDGAPVATITAVKSFDFTWKQTIKTEEYVGETSPRKDDFFEGLSGKIDFDLETEDALTLAESIRARAQSRSSTTKIAISTTLRFPNGDRAVLRIPNAFFSDIPLNVAGRTEYGHMTLTWEAETGKIISR